MQRLRSVTFPTVACAALALVTGCTAPEVPPPPPPEVVVETPIQRDVTNFANFTGNTQAIESVEIRARVDGELEEFTFEPASGVRKGQLLFRIEQAPYIAARDRAKAEVDSAKAAVERTESDVDRLEQAVEKNAVSQQEVTRARAERDQAIAALASAEASLRLEISKQYPTIRFGPEFEDDRGEPTIGLGFGVTLPLFDRNKGNIAAAEESRQRARERMRRPVETRGRKRAPWSWPQLQMMPPDMPCCCKVHRNR